MGRLNLLKGQSAQLRSYMAGDWSSNVAYEGFISRFRPGKYFQMCMDPAAQEVGSKFAFASDKLRNPPFNEDTARAGWAQLRAHVPLSFRRVKPWTVDEDRQLRKGVHYFLQKARLLSKERMSLEEIAGVGVVRLEALLDRSRQGACG